MNIETWMKLVGKSQDDPTFKAALAAAGVKSIPKLAKDDVSVTVSLEGHGMGLKLVDEAWMKNPDPAAKNPQVGKGPLILTNVYAYIQRKKNNDLYKGTLPYNLTPDMTQGDVRKTLGPPKSQEDWYDLWLRDGVHLLVAYSKDSKISHLSFDSPDYHPM